MPCAPCRTTLSGGNSNFRGVIFTMEDFIKPFLEKSVVDSLGKADGSADIDLKFLEGNLENIFCNILAQKQPVENFSKLYETFLQDSFKTFAKFQRAVKFITKFLASVKTTPTVLSKNEILPASFVNEFSKTVAVASNQQSLSLLDVLVNTLADCFNLFLQNDSNAKPLIFITSELLVSFFKEVKLYAPSISFITLGTFIEKLNGFIKTLKEFGCFLFNSKSFMFKNEDVIKTFLELCFYCEEIHALIGCYKDSVLQTSELNDSAAEGDWQCCLSLEQWNKLINFIMKSKLETCSSVCFQMALQKVRILKLKNTVSLSDASTLKIIHQRLSSDFSNFNIFREVSPEDFIILTEILTAEHFKSVVKTVFSQTLQNGDKTESQSWLSNSTFQENSAFIVALLTEMLKETGSYLGEVVEGKNYSRMSWLGDEYFDEKNCIRAESLELLPEKINVLLKNGRKIGKSLKKNLKRMDSLARIVEIFKLLPLQYMNDEFRRLGLSFAIGIGVLLAGDENPACLAFECVCSFLASDTDASTCFDIGLCIRWLSELYYENNKANELRLKVIETLIRNSPNMKSGLSQMGEMINSLDTFKQEDPLKMLETRVVLYNELGKCWQRAKKRKSDNDLIGGHRNKLAKMISEESKDLQSSGINPENCKILFKVFAIELNKAVRMNEESEIQNLMKTRFPSYFEFAVKNLKRSYEDTSALFLIIVLQSMPQLRTIIPEDSLLRIWKALKIHEKVNWRLFCSHSSDEEFSEMLEDLLKMSKKFLISDKFSTNCFEIWVSFFEYSTKTKRQSCQIHLQEFFNHVHNVGLLLRDLPIRKKIFLIKFFHFCLSKKEVIVTSHVLDTIIHVILECLDGASSTEDFHNLFAIEVDVASAILLRQFAWSRSKVHLTFVIFKRLLGALMTRCDPGQQINKDDVIMLSTCAFCLEKWVSVIIKKEKDFARTAAYFITALISSIASVTVLPAIKIHLTNCINHFLSISDSHTVAYLMRILKPGYQQVFNTMYNQFKKYHKYSGKI